MSLLHATCYQTGAHLSNMQKCLMNTGGRESFSDEQARKAIDSCAQMLISRFDEERGGFGTSPKFPRPSELNLLLVKHIRAKAAGSRAEAGLLSLLDLIRPYCTLAVRHPDWYDHHPLERPFCMTTSSQDIKNNVVLRYGCIP